MLGGLPGEGRPGKVCDQDRVRSCLKPKRADFIAAMRSRGYWPTGLQERERDYGA